MTCLADAADNGGKEGLIKCSLLWRDDAFKLSLQQKT